MSTTQTTVATLLRATSNFKAVLFDMDGTLVQMHPHGRMVVLNETLAIFGIEPISDIDTVERFWFTSDRYGMIDQWGMDRKLFWKTFDCERLMQLQISHTYAYEDVAGVLVHLRRQGLQLGIVSNSAHISLGHKLNLLEQHITREDFQIIVSCTDDVTRTKPSADGITFALNRLNIAPHEAVLVGDSLDDINAGIAADVGVIIVNRGQMPDIYKRLDTDGITPNFQVVNSLQDLPHMLGITELPIFGNQAA